MKKVVSTFVMAALVGVAVCAQADESQKVTTIEVAPIDDRPGLPPNIHAISDPEIYPPVRPVSVHGVGSGRAPVRTWCMAGLYPARQASAKRAQSMSMPLAAPKIFLVLFL